MSSILLFDDWLFTLINSAHYDWLNFVMKTFSGKLIWAPLYLFLIYKLYAFQKKKIWLTVLFLGLMIGVTDQVSYRVKKSEIRPRPCNELVNWEKPVNMVNHNYETVNTNCGGYGYFSGHASNTMALAMFFVMILSKYQKSSWYKFLFVWAFLVSYSRIYLGVHYPFDVITGMIFGAIMGFVFYKGLNFSLLKLSK